MKFAPQELSMKNGGRLLLREAQGTDAGAVLAYLNRVGGESDNLLFGKDGFPLPVEREAAFLERQRQEERSILVLGFAGEELVCVASCDALTARERVAHRASVSLTVARDYWGQGIGRGVMEALSPLPGRRGWRSSSWRCAPTTPGPWPSMSTWALRSWACTAIS